VKDHRLVFSRLESATTVPGARYEMRVTLFLVDDA
jgi:hypothetical protein